MRTISRAASELSGMVRKASRARDTSLETLSRVATGALVSAAAFGSGPLFAKPAYALGLGWLPLLAWRFTLAACLSWSSYWPERTPNLVYPCPTSARMR